MPHVGTVEPSYASDAKAWRLIEYEIAHRTFGLPSGGLAFCTINARGQGSSQAYGASGLHALTLALRWATLRNVPSDRMPMLGVSRSLLLSASAVFVSGPA